MSKAVLISIRPEYCVLIASGEKTIEVRKKRPKIQTPFKCYIYCTKSEPTVMVKPAQRIGNGLVIGEFICDAIQEVYCFDIEGNKCYQWHDPECDAPKWAWFLESKACLPYRQLEQYLNSGNGYAWHISDLKIYDQPQKLREFRKPLYCHRGNDRENCTGCWDCEIKRPPQSWCYVEELT